ncbi:uncharacterized protein [Coffea arabica]|uniref:Reverse transcriptase zinc-binding domain-containing protein n=1 Tax=Coffea arabica TaxID=13443 RepID=A0ABM4W2E1_COFAR
MPIHLLAASSPPQGVLVDVEKLFADFLWGSSDFGTHFHWIRWEKLCRPREEGVLGCEQQSLWADFMSRKYCAGLHPYLTEETQWGSHTWRRMIAVQQVGKDNIGWIVRQGLMDFWHDNWLGSGALCSKVEIFYDHIVADFVDGGPGMSPCLINIWMQGWLGTYWKWLLHPFGVLIEWSGASHLLVKIPIMDRLRRFGLRGPSRCWCCREPREEDLEHVFCSGKGARLVWRHFEIQDGELEGVHTEMAEPVHGEQENCDCPIHLTGCDVARLRMRQRFYRDRFLEELERATDGARKAYALSDRVANQR